MRLLFLAELAHDWRQEEMAAKLFGLAEHLLPKTTLRLIASVKNQRFADIRQAVRKEMGENAFR